MVRAGALVQRLMNRDSFSLENRQFQGDLLAASQEQPETGKVVEEKDQGSL